MIDLFRPRLTVSSKIFQFVFVHLFYNSALCLVPWYCSFLLYVLANLICIFVVSRQLVLLSTFPKFLHSFCGQNEWARLFFWKKSCWLMWTVFILFRVQISLPYNSGGAVHYIYFYSWKILDQSWLKVLFRIPSIWRTVASLCWISPSIT